MTSVRAHRRTGDPNVPIPSALPSSGRVRAVVEDVRPSLDAGRFPIKRVVGDRVTVDCDAFADGHDELAVRLRHREAGEGEWREVPMDHVGNDRWAASWMGVR